MISVLGLLTMINQNVVEDNDGSEKHKKRNNRLCYFTLPLLLSFPFHSDTAGWWFQVYHIQQ